jgi:hypothetical protein
MLNQSVCLHIQSKLPDPIIVKASAEALAEGEDKDKKTSSRFRLIVERTRVPHGKAMAVECQELFGEKPAIMSCPKFPVWELDAQVPQTTLPVAYRKFHLSLFKRMCA